MAQTNQNPASSTQNGNKMPFPVVAYNRLGIMPEAARYIIQADLLCTNILAMARDMVPDFTECTILGSEDKKIRPSVYLFIPKNSDAISDRRLMDDENSIITQPISRLSPKMKELIHRFSHEDEQNAIMNATTDGFKCVKLDLADIVIAFFDENGDGYRKTIGDKGAMKTTITLDVGRWGKDGKRVETIVVTKSVNNGGGRGRDMQPVFVKRL